MGYIFFISGFLFTIPNIDAFFGAKLFYFVKTLGKKREDYPNYFAYIDDYQNQIVSETIHQKSLRLAITIFVTFAGLILCMKGIQ